MPTIENRVTNDTEFTITIYKHSGESTTPKSSNKESTSDLVQVACSTVKYKDSVCEFPGLEDANYFVEIEATFNDKEYKEEKDGIEINDGNTEVVRFKAVFEGSGVPVQPNVILVQTPTFLGKSLTGLKTLGEDNKTKDIEFTLTLKINDTTEFDNKAIKTTFRDGKSAFITTDEIAGKDVILTIEATLTDIVITDTTRASEDMLDGFTFKLVKAGKFPTNTGKGENGFSSNLDNKLFEISENDLDIVQPVTIVNKSGISSVKLLRKAPIALTNNNTYQAFGVADNNQLIGIKGTKDTSSESFTKFTSEEMNFENPVTNSNIDKITTINSNVANGSNAFAGFTVNKEDTTTEGEVYGGLAKLVEDNGTYKWVRQSQDINRGFDPTAKIYYMIFADDANDNKDYFVGVSDQGQIVYSLVDNSTDEDKENSLEWNKADISKINGFENHNVKAIAYGEINNEKMFVAMGKGGIPVYAKGDPSIWSSGNYVDSKNPFKDTDDVDRMIYTNLNGSPLFVAVGGNQHTAISKDGKTWQGLTIDQGSSSSNTDHIYSITALGDKAVILSLKDYIYYLSKTNDSTYQWIKAKKQDGTFSWKTKSTESDRAFDLYAVKNPKNDETSTSSYEYKVLCAGNSGEIVSFIATVGNDGTVTCAGAEREYPSTNSVDLGNEYSLWAFAEGKNSIIAVGGGIRESKRSGTSTDKDIQEKKGGFIIKTSKTSNNNWDDIGNSWEVIYENITGNSKYNIGIFDNYYAIKAAAYGNGMYVVAGFEGNIAYSKDEGVSWEPFAASSTSKTIPDNVTGIANNWKTGSEEVFVAVGSSKIGGSTIPTLSMIKNPSNSESKWEDIPITDKMKSIVDENGSRVWEKFLNIIYFPGNTGLAAENENRYTGFFAFGDIGTILKSEDGTEWEIEKGPDYHTINGERIFATNGSSIMILPGNDGGATKFAYIYQGGFNSDGSGRWWALPNLSANNIDLVGIRDDEYIAITKLPNSDETTFTLYGGDSTSDKHVTFEVPGTNMPKINTIMRVDNKTLLVGGDSTNEAPIAIIKYDAQGRNPAEGSS